MFIFQFLSVLLHPTPMCLASVAHSLSKCNKYYWTLFRKPKGSIVKGQTKLFNFEFVPLVAIGLLNLQFF